jgi:hypothetical protein
MLSKLDEWGADAIIILFLSGRFPIISQLIIFKNILPRGPNIYLFFMG